MVIITIYLLIPMLLIAFATTDHGFKASIRAKDLELVIFGLLVFIVVWPMFVIARLLGIRG